MNKLIKDLTGQTFGRLTVIEHDASIKSNQCAYWKVKCICGNTKSVRRTSLLSGKTKSCGCLNKEKPYLILPNNQAILNRHYKSYKHNAARRNYSFELTLFQFHDLVNQNCHYCNAYPDENRRSSTDERLKFNGIDRKDNTKGYTIENTVPCCGRCNRAKDTMTYHEYIAWIHRSHNHLSK